MKKIMINGIKNAFYFFKKYIYDLNKKKKQS